MQEHLSGGAGIDFDGEGHDVVLGDAFPSISTLNRRLETGSVPPFFRRTPTVPAVSRLAPGLDEDGVDGDIGGFNREAKVRLPGTGKRVAIAGSVIEVHLFLPEQASIILPCRASASTTLAGARRSESCFQLLYDLEHRWASRPMVSRGGRRLAPKLTLPRRCHPESKPLSSLLMTRPSPGARRGVARRRRRPRRAAAPPRTARARQREWPAHGGDPGHTQHSALAQITAANVARLRVAWTYHTGDARADGRSQIQCNPVVVDGVLYATSAGLKAFALDAATGRERWRFDPFAAGAEENALGVNRGVVYWREGEDERVLYSAGQYLFALDARTGKLVAGFGKGGRVDLRDGLGRDPAGLFVLSTTPGAVYRDLLILGTRVHEGPGPSSPGHVRAYDVRTGSIRWTFHTIPGPGEPGYDTWPADAWRTVGGANAWSGISVDDTRGLVFLPTGSPAWDFWGGDRHGANLFGNCVLGPEGGHRRARLALPGRAPRPVGPRPAAGAGARDREARRAHGGRRLPGHEVGARVRLRPRDGRAALPDRGARRAALGPEGRAGLPDPAACP